MSFDCSSSKPTPDFSNTISLLKEDGSLIDIPERFFARPDDAGTSQQQDPFDLEPEGPIPRSQEDYENPEDPTHRYSIHAVHDDESIRSMPSRPSTSLSNHSTRLDDQRQPSDQDWQEEQADAGPAAAAEASHLRRSRLNAANRRAGQSPPVLAQVALPPAPHPEPAPSWPFPFTSAEAALLTVCGSSHSFRALLICSPQSWVEHVFDQSERTPTLDLAIEILEGL